MAPSKSLPSFFYPFRTVWELLDAFIGLASPLAIIGFIIVCIMVLDAFGQHIQFLRGIDQQGVESVGAWSHPSRPGGYGYVAFDKEEHGQTGVVVSTKYYRENTLASLKDGQRVRVRYALPPDYEAKAVLVDAYGQVKGYAGFFTDYIWPIFFCWLAVTIHPEFLYLGFTNPFPKGRSAAKGRQP